MDPHAVPVICVAPQEDVVHLAVSRDGPLIVPMIVPQTAATAIGVATSAKIIIQAHVLVARRDAGIPKVAQITVAVVHAAATIVIIHGLISRVAVIHAPSATIVVVTVKGIIVTARVVSIFTGLDAHQRLLR